MKGSSLVGFINFTTFLLGIPVLGGGIWLSSRANTRDCVTFLQWPYIVIGIFIMVISLAGFAGTCYRNNTLSSFYLFSMFITIGALIGFVIFAYGVTDKGSGRAVVGRTYFDYYLMDYSGWLEERVTDERYWLKISTCVRESNVCARLRRDVGGILEPAEMFYTRRLTPVESGCCKPPTECNYIYVNETTWNPGGGPVGGSIDCLTWNNDQLNLCYGCESCKAGVLGGLRESWRKVSLINIVIIVLLVIVYVMACVAKRKIDSSYGMNRMSKAQPSRIHF